ncbi:MAG: hypothetical protein KatS3mg050_3065 [Litorilinea sp.]|nr:MAG: hypothetical protein KatS3mg050_3065 [Litorilinea sp.]
MSQSWQIGQVARQVDLSPKTIRYYESIGLLPEPRARPQRIPSIHGGGD